MSFHGRPLNHPKFYHDFFNESVFNLRPEVKTQFERPARYVSQFSNGVREQFHRSKKPKKTFGVPRLTREIPSKFLKQSTTFKPCPQPFPDKCQYSQICRKVETWNKIGLRPLSRDMIQKTKNTILALRPKEPVHVSVDRCDGSKQVLERAGLTAKYVFKPNYGKIPDYLKRNESQTSGTDKNTAFRVQGTERPPLLPQYRKVSSEERAELLQNLQNNFNEAMREFQGLSVSLDNQTKLKEKLALEKALNEIERTIDTITRLKTIVISID